MSEIAAIQAAIGSLRLATDLVKVLRESDLNLEKAELKNRIADLVGALADLKMQLADAQGEALETEKIVSELRQALEEKSKVIRHWDAYYLVGAQGEAEGDPFCLRCYEGDHKLRRLVRATGEMAMVCHACKSKYEARRAGHIAPKGTSGA